MDISRLVEKLNFSDGYSLSTACDNQNIIIKADDNAENVVEVIKNTTNLVQEFNKDNEEQVILMFNLKEAKTEQKIDALKYGFSTPTLDDPLMQLNLYNLIKSYNNMNDEFFASSDVYFNSVEELLDIKLALGVEIKAFIRQLSIYYMSLFKSYNKLFFTPSDEHISLPTLYKNMILTSDLLTLSGIFAKSPEFSTNELIYIDDAYVYLTALITRSNNSMDLIDDFLNGLNVNNEVK
jgi:hypothetical protein